MAENQGEESLGHSTCDKYGPVAKVEFGFYLKGGAQLIAPMCTCSESFASPSKNAVSLILQFLASKCSGRCSN